MWRQSGRATVHFSLHSDKRRGVGHIQKGPPTRLIKLLRCRGPVSFASLTLRQFNTLYMKHLTFYSQRTYWSQFDVGRVPPWNSSKLLTESCWPKFSPFQIILFHLIYATKAFEKTRSDWVLLKVECWGGWVERIARGGIHMLYCIMV